MHILIIAAVVVGLVYMAREGGATAPTPMDPPPVNPVPFNPQANKFSTVPNGIASLTASAYAAIPNVETYGPPAPPPPPPAPPQVIGVPTTTTTRGFGNVTPSSPAPFTPAIPLPAPVAVAGFTPPPTGFETRSGRGHI
jgi:hypothetical protein